MTDRPTFDALLAVATASARYAFASSAPTLDMDPTDRQRAAALQFDAVQEIEEAMQALGRQIGPENAETARLAILAGLTGRSVSMLHAAATG